MPIQFAAGLSLAAKIALGAGLAAAGATGAAAAGALPDPVQHAAAAVVRTVTPFEVPDVADDATTKPAADTPVPTTFGSRVSSEANGTDDGTHGVDGATISSEAKAKHDDARCTNVPTGAPDAATDDAATDDAATDDAATDDAATDDAAPGDHPGCKPDASTGKGKPAAPGQNGLNTAGSTPANGHVPTSTPGGPATGDAASGGNHSKSSRPSDPATSANDAPEAPASPATPAVAPTQDAPALPAIPATPAIAPPVPEPASDGGLTPPAPAAGATETPPVTPGDSHHS